MENLGKSLKGKNLEILLLVLFYERCGNKRNRICDAVAHHHMKEISKVVMSLVTAFCDGET